MPYLGMTPSQLVTIGARTVGEDTILDGAGTYEVDATLHGFWILTVEGDTEFSFDFGSSTTNAGDVILQIINTSNNAITWDASVDWPGNTPPSISTTGVHLARFYRNTDGDIFGESIGINYS